MRPLDPAFSGHSYNAHPRGHGVRQAAVTEGGAGCSKMKADGLLVGGGTPRNSALLAGLFAERSARHSSKELRQLEGEVGELLGAGRQKAGLRRVACNSGMD
jgi:hypothetical protein